MVHSVKGIVLHRLKYSDSKLILKILTDKFGLRTYLFFISKSTKQRSKLNLLQPMYFLDMNVYHKETGGIQKIKDFQADKIYTSIPFDVIKQTISFFCAEFLLKTIHENNEDKEMFLFLSGMFDEFDSLQKRIADFTVFFLYHFTQYLGIKPQENFSDKNKIFDLEKGRFIFGRPNHQNFLNEQNSILFNKLSQIQNLDTEKYLFKNAERNILLQSLINYYNIHLERPGKLKSLDVLKQIFR